MQSHHKIFEDGFSISALKMQPYWCITFSGPHEDLDRIFDEMVKIHHFEYGKTDRNAFVSAAGLEYYRPMEGTPTGAENDIRKRPHIMEMRLAIPPDETLLKSLLTLIYTFHSYYEPPIAVAPFLRSATTGLDDSDNPHRWWNKDGDWKKE